VISFDLFSAGTAAVAFSSESAELFTVKNDYYNKK
jgi:hypothetical protein